MFLYGVVNASPDSLNTDSIATTPDAAVARARRLLADGADGIDLGGQGSTDAATVVDWREEWERLAPIVPALAALEVPLSIDSWRPEVVRRALEAGATVLNAADGMQSEAMWDVAAEFDAPIVVPFLSGPDPADGPRPARSRRGHRRVLRGPSGPGDRRGARHRCILDPGTGFAPPAWPWEERYLYQKRVYTNLDALRRFELPLYIALPWKETAQHDELLEIVVAQDPEFGRAHYPAKVRAFERRVHGISG